MEFCKPMQGPAMPDVLNPYTGPRQLMTSNIFGQEFLVLLDVVFFFFFRIGRLR